MAALSELGRIAKAQQFDYGRHTGDAIRALGGEPRVRDKHYQSYAAAKEEQGRRAVPRTAAAGALLGGGAGYAMGSSREKNLAKVPEQRGAKPGGGLKGPRGRVAATAAGGAIIGGAALGALAQSNRKKVERGLRTTGHRRAHDAKIVGLSDAVRDARAAKERKESAVAKSLRTKALRTELSDPMGWKRLKEARAGGADAGEINSAVKRARIRTGAAGTLGAGTTAGGAVYASRAPQRRARRFERAVAATGTGM